jgi:regulator of protease activity HflC (stomatin/prohibitin superfamily)
MSSCCGWACVNQSNVGIVERFGEFADVLPPGCTFIGCTQSLRGEVSLRERLMHVQTESATEDRVILTLKCVVMFHVIPSECHTAYYSLSSLSQIKSFVESAMRSEMARVTYENIFLARQQIRLPRTLSTRLRGR